MVPTTAFSVCSSAAVETTSTRSCNAPSSSLKSTRAVCAADNVTVDWTRLKPWSSAAITYTPIGTLVMM